MRRIRIEWLTYQVGSSAAVSPKCELRDVGSVGMPRMQAHAARFVADVACLSGHALGRNHNWPQVVTSNIVPSGYSRERACCEGFGAVLIESGGADIR